MGSRIAVWVDACWRFRDVVSYSPNPDGRRGVHDTHVEVDPTPRHVLCGFFRTDAPFVSALFCLLAVWARLLIAEFNASQGTRRVLAGAASRGSWTLRDPVR